MKKTLRELFWGGGGVGGFFFLNVLKIKWETNFIHGLIVTRQGRTILN